MVASAIPDAIQLCLHILRRNRTAFRPNSHLSSHFDPAIIPGTRRSLRANIFPENPVTGCISVKILIKLREPFFPSGIIDLGALASLEYPARGDIPAWLLYTLAPTSRARGSSQPWPFAAPRIFDNCINRHQRVARAHSLRSAISLAVAEPSAALGPAEVYADNSLSLQ